ncbi:hypothetical protein GJ496_002966 [Pomphorhynchus laevis]|nr:hypothetical protein GJ496_002966 [Pomphorhynchus laevis]
MDSDNRSLQHIKQVTRDDIRLLPAENVLKQRRNSRFGRENTNRIYSDRRHVDESKHQFSKRSYRYDDRKSPIFSNRDESNVRESRNYPKLKDKYSMFYSDRNTDKYLPMVRRDSNYSHEEDMNFTTEEESNLLGSHGDITRNANSTNVEESLLYMSFSGPVSVATFQPTSRRLNINTGKRARSDRLKREEDVDHKVDKQPVDNTENDGNNYIEIGMTHSKEDISSNVDVVDVQEKILLSNKLETERFLAGLDNHSDTMHRKMLSNIDKRMQRHRTAVQNSDVSVNKLPRTKTDLSLDFEAGQKLTSQIEYPEAQKSRCIYSDNEKKINELQICTKRLITRNDNAMLNSNKNDYLKINTARRLVKITKNKSDVSPVTDCDDASVESITRTCFSNYTSGETRSSLSINLFPRKSEYEAHSKLNVHNVKLKKLDKSHDKCLKNTSLKSCIDDIVHYSGSPSMDHPVCTENFTVKNDEYDSHKLCICSAHSLNNDFINNERDFNSLNALHHSQEENIRLEHNLKSDQTKSDLYNLFCNNLSNTHSRLMANDKVIALSGNKCLNSTEDALDSQTNDPRLEYKSESMLQRNCVNETHDFTKTPIADTNENVQNSENDHITHSAAIQNNTEYIAGMTKSLTLNNTKPLSAVVDIPKHQSFTAALRQFLSIDNDSTSNLQVVRSKFQKPVYDTNEMFLIPNNDAACEQTPIFDYSQTTIVKRKQTNSHNQQNKRLRRLSTSDANYTLSFNHNYINSKIKRHGLVDAKKEKHAIKSLSNRKRYLPVPTSDRVKLLLELIADLPCVTKIASPYILKASRDRQSLEFRAVESTWNKGDAVLIADKSRFQQEISSKPCKPATLAEQSQFHEFQIHEDDEVKIKYLGSLQGEDLSALHEAAKRIAGESSREFIFVSKQFWPLIQKVYKCVADGTPIYSTNSLPPVRSKVSLKIFLSPTEGCEPTSEAVITVIGPSLVRFLIGDCPSFFTTSLSKLETNNISFRRLTSFRKFNTPKQRLLAHIRATRLAKKRALYRKLNSECNSAVGNFNCLKPCPLTCIIVRAPYLHVADISGRLNTFYLSNHKRYTPCCGMVCEDGVHSMVACPYLSCGICLFIAGFDGLVRIYGRKTGIRFAQINVGTAIHSLYVKFKYLCVGDSSGHLLIFNRKRIGFHKAIPSGTSIISSISGIRMCSELMIVVGSYDGNIYWHYVDRDPVVSGAFQRGHNKPARSLKIDTKINRMYSCSADRIVVIHDLVTGNVIRKLNDFTDIVTSVVLQHRENNIIASSFDGLINIYDYKTTSLILRYDRPDKRIMCIFYNYSNLYVASDDGVVECIKYNPNEYVICEYANCGMRLASIGDLRSHLLRSHFLTKTSVYRCRWPKCTQWLRSSILHEHADFHAKQCELINEESMQSDKGANMERK